MPRRFETEKNAAVTASCLRGGYVRVKPRDGDRAVDIKGQRWVATAAPVDTRVDAAGDEWIVLIIFRC